MKLQLTEEQKRRRRNKYQREYYQRKRSAKKAAVYNSISQPTEAYQWKETYVSNESSILEVNKILLETITKLTHLYGNN